MSKKNYEAICSCMNCRNPINIKVPFGQTIKSYHEQCNKSGTRFTCKYCGCESIWYIICNEVE